MRFTRRSFIISAGVFAIGGGIIVGSGAFGTRGVNSDLTIEFADDSSAYLEIGSIEGDDRDHISINNGREGVVTISVESANAGARTVFDDLVAFTNNSPRAVEEFSLEIDDESINADLSVIGAPSTIPSGETVTGLGLVVDTRDYSGDPKLQATIRIRSFLAPEGS